MIELDNVEIMINQMFAHEPQATVTVSENKKPIAILNKEDWESNRFNHIKEKCRQYIPPFFVDRREIPFVGVGINVDLANCERRWVSGE